MHRTSFDRCILINISVPVNIHLHLLIDKLNSQPVCQLP